MTAELGPEAWYAFQSAFVARYGPDRVGVRTSNGDEVFQPPEYAMYSYDFVRLLIAAIGPGGRAQGGRRCRRPVGTARGAPGGHR